MGPFDDDFEIDERTGDFKCLSEEYGYDREYDDDDYDNDYDNDDDDYDDDDD